MMILLILFVNSGITETLAFTEAEKAEKLALIKRIKSKGEIVYAIIPKNSRELFFDEAAKGCIETAKKLGVHCVYYGSSEENMRLQEKDILSLISAGIDGIAVAAIKKGWIADRIGEKLNKWGKPIIAFDSPLSSEISQAYIGTDNYLLGKALGVEIKKLRPNGGTFCIQAERPDSPNHNDRLKGIMDGMTRDGQDQEKWKNTLGCPIQTFGNYERATKQMVKMIGNYGVEIFISTGGGSQFLPEQYRKAIEPFKNNIKTGKLIFANIDTIPAQIEYLKEGISTVNVGQRPYEMGKWSVTILKMITDGETPPLVIYTGITKCTQKTADTCTK